MKAKLCCIIFQTQERYLQVLQPELTLDSVYHHDFSILRDPNISLLPSMDLYNPYPC